MASKPIFSKPARSYTNSAEYIKQMEELTKKNKGGFSAFAEDTGSSIPFMLPGRRVASALPTQSVQKAQAQLPEEQDYAIEEITPELPPEMPQEGFSVNDFIDQLSQSTGYSQPSQEQMQAIADQTGMAYAVSEYEGGKVLNTGEKLDNTTGAITKPDGQVIYPNRSFPGGGVGYDNGEVRYYDPLMVGITGFTSQIFGIPLEVTQAYGEVNPIEPTPGNVNIGTDLRTKNLTNKSFSLPVSAKVIQIYKDDGRNPYGNSVLLQLPTGEMVRLSHLSNLGNYQEGQDILPGQYVGTTGATGNVTGEHLDVEYYGQDGQLKDLKDFSGFTNPEQFIAASQTTEQPTAPSAPMMSQPQMSSQPVQPQTQQLQQPTQNPLDMLNQRASELGINVANKIEQAQPTGDYGLGLTETAKGNPVGASQEIGSTINKVGTNLNLPEMDLGEAAANPAQPGILGSLRQVAGQTLENISDAIPRELNDKYIKPITGNALSELVAGGQTKDTVSAYANDNMASIDPNANVDVLQSQAYKDSLLGRAGEGIDKLKKGFSGLFSKGNSLFNRPASADISGSRAVGEVSGQTGNVLGATSNAQFDATKPQNDARDPFFKGQGSAQFANYLQGGDTGGALTLDMFSPEFFQDKGNIQSVFGSTPHLMTGAMSKFQAYEDQKRAEEQARAEDMKQKPGELTEEWMKRTGQQSTIDQIRKQGGTVDQQPSQSDFTYNEIKDYKNVTPQETATAVNNIFRNRPSVQQSKGLREYEVPVAQSSARLNTQAQQKAQQPSLFQKAASAISNIFKRKFN